MNSEITQIIGEICTANSLGESLRIFNRYSNRLQNCKIIFAAKNGTIPGFSINRDFSDGSVIRSLFGSGSVLVLDRETIDEMKIGRAIYPFDYSISLDTQALSYLEPYILGNSSRLPKDFEEIFRFISREDVNVDPLPYILENLLNLSDPDKAERIFEKIKAYEVLRTIDVYALDNLGIVQSKLDNAELIKRTQELISIMYRDLSDQKVVDGVKFNFDFCYWHLLAMISIQLSTPKMSIEEKLRALIELCDSKLATLSLREITVAKAYFERGQNLTFFGKVQKGKKDLFSVVQGMAWDMWHIRQMEKNLTIRPSSEARYFFPSFLTCDKRLVEIIELYPLKACAYDDRDLIPMPFFDGDWLASLSSSKDFIEGLYSIYFSDKAVLSRNKRRDEATNVIKNSVSELESIVAEISGVNP
ncbi:MAG: hypothetical protein CVV11_14460 [Gammaproteobacteria bacterium HGW-Gammaproteobacteria-15]|nr:MAG: hypothetical protein CVV11_14460 [Gammaproteobacteria bacterium HGW-Gammaproteobacteria-15]